MPIDIFIPVRGAKIFALDGPQGNCNVITFLEIFEDMESIWKMELSLKEPSLWHGMIPGKIRGKMEKETPRRGKTFALFGYLKYRKTQKEKTEVQKIKGI